MPPIICSAKLEICKLKLFLHLDEISFYKSKHLSILDAITTKRSRT